MELHIKHEETTVVTEQNIASVVDPMLPPVYATPQMIALMEKTCFACVQPYLEEGCITVGVGINVKHSAATPIGQTIRCTCELIEIDRKMLRFAVTAYDEKGEIGSGEHQRAIVNREKFISRL